MQPEVMTFVVPQHVTVSIEGAGRSVVAGDPRSVEEFGLLLLLDRYRLAKGLRAVCGTAHEDVTAGEWT
jgi:hypothetical protein